MSEKSSKIKGRTSDFFAKPRTSLIKEGGIIRLNRMRKKVAKQAKEARYVEELYDAVLTRLPKTPTGWQRFFEARWYL